MTIDKHKKKVCVFTGARSDYGLLKPLMEEIDNDPDLELVTIVSGMHLSKEFGLTYQQIEVDGFLINEKVEMPLESDTPEGIGKSMGLGLKEFAAVLKRCRPHVLVVLGDRYETFSVVVAATLLNIPIAHIHGGELTYGVWDDAFRHSITKMSLLHFTCADKYKRRVIQMGESPDRVFNTGALGVEQIVQADIISKNELYSLLGFNRNDPFFLVTFHPVTREHDKNQEYFKSVLTALSDDRFKTYKLVFTQSNSDSCGRKINTMIDQFIRMFPQRAVGFDTMGHANYTGAMAYASAMIGNSSSGIIEAPCFRLPVINIGTRQDGRVRSENIIDCPPETDQIIAALEFGLSDSFHQDLDRMENPFFKKGTALTIKNIIKDYDFSGHLMKAFFDINIPVEGY